MTSVWMGWKPIGAAISDGDITMTGNRQFSDTIQTWLKLSPFAHEKQLVAA